MHYEKVLDFWFNELNEEDWFKHDSRLDNKICDKFLNFYNEVITGKYMDYKEKPKSILALIIVLDQFSRNMFRGDEKMYAFDKMALNLSKEAIDKGFDLVLENKQRSFIYLPLMHSEELEDQKECVKLFEKLSNEDSNFRKNLSFAKDHMRIVEMFGRFPHRNEILGRKSTPEEIEFLKMPGSSF